MKNTKFYFAVLFSLLLSASSFYANASDLANTIMFAKLYKSGNVAVNVFLAKGSTSKKIDPKVYIEIENIPSQDVNDNNFSEIFLKVAEQDHLSLRVYIYDKDGNVITNVPKVKMAGQTDGVKTKTLSIKEGQKKLFEFPLDQNILVGLEEEYTYRVYIKFRKFVSWKFDDGQWGRINVSDISFESVLFN